MGDALLQKTYTADFITKQQIKNHGEVTQYYVEDSHEGIIDKETGHTVQDEFKRREAFMAEHGLKKYYFGKDYNPFTNRVFCGNCGSPYNRHAWTTRNKVQWQCINHRHDGALTCDNRHAFEHDIKAGFVKAFNSIYKDKAGFIKRKKEQQETGSRLERLRAKQMLKLIKEPPLKCFVPEVAQLVLESVIVYGAKEYEFHFLDGTVRRVRV